MLSVVIVEISVQINVTPHNGCTHDKDCCLDLAAHSEVDVKITELVKASQHTSSSHTTQDVGTYYTHTHIMSLPCIDTHATDNYRDLDLSNVLTCSLHEGHEALVLEDLNGAVDGALVLDLLT